MSNVLYRFLGIIDNLTAIRQGIGDREHTLIRPYNQAILMYPTAIFGLIAWISLAIWNFSEASVGRIYVWTLFINYLVLFFDLRFQKAVIVIFGAVILGFILHTYGALGDFLAFFGGLNPEMNSTFYLLHTIIFGLIFFFVWVDRRSYVIVVEPNHVVIHDKWIGEANSYPTENVTFSKEVGDALELMLGFGTLKIANASNGQLIRAVPHVFGITAALDDIKRVTAQLQVEEKGHKH
jgi:hypothetical protein